MPNKKKMKKPEKNRAQFLRTVSRTGKWRGKPKTLNDLKK